MKLADTAAIAFMLRRPQATIRKWAQRYPDQLPRRGTDHRGRALYSIDDACHLNTVMTSTNPIVETTRQPVSHFKDLAVSMPAARR